MVNSDTARTVYTTVEGVTEYGIGFQYYFNTDDTPQLKVKLGDQLLVYGDDYLISENELNIVLSEEPEAGLKVEITRNIPLTQTSDYVIGRIDPDQIERDFDLAVMRDQSEYERLSGYAAKFESEIADLQENKQDVIADLDTIRDGASAGATAVQPSDLSSVATSGSYDDLTDKPTIPAAQVNSDWNAASGVAQILNKPTIPDTTNMQTTTNLVTSVSAASTDAQYPSAKLFYDTCGDIETLINAL